LIDEPTLKLKNYSGIPPSKVNLNLSFFVHHSPSCTISILMPNLKNSNIMLFTISFDGFPTQANQNGQEEFTGS